MLNPSTTIKISSEMMEKLKSFKKYKKETYDEILERLLAELKNLTMQQMKGGDE